MDSNTQNRVQRLKPNLTGAQETLLAILYSRALDAKTTTPILGDRYAVRLVDQLDYNFSKLRIIWLKAAAIALRARFLDQWTAEFLQQSQHDGEPVTILHLAAGLDTRALRLQQHCNKDGANIRWVDVDLPDVIDVRRRLRLPEPDGDRMQYEMAAADVTDELWLAKIGLPRDRKTLVVFEGLSMYLQPPQGRALIENLTNHFVKPGNQLVFDCFNWFPLLVQRFEPIVASTGSRMSWAINDPRELEEWLPGLHLTGEVLPSDNPENVRLPIIMRWFCWIVLVDTGTAHLGQVPQVRVVMRAVPRDFCLLDYGTRPRSMVRPQRQTLHTVCKIQETLPMYEHVATWSLFVNPQEINTA